MTDEEAAAVTAILENVGRLVDDATVLIEADRFPSAFVLNVIALEEIGKVILLRWRSLGLAVSRQNRTQHLQKQWAVASLLIADVAFPHFIRFYASPPDQQPLRIVELAEEFMDSKERRFFEEVIAANLDRAKQLGLYEDESNQGIGRTRGEIDAGAVATLNQTLMRAMPLLEDDAIITVAHVFYEITPPMQADILAYKDEH